jgi:hypothetical protein
VPLFLDAHISGRSVAAALRERGHDVRAASEERQLDGMTDDDLLALAAAEGRILVTFNVADFPDIVRRWAEEGRSHTGCMIVVGIDHREFGQILTVLQRTLDARQHADDWRNYTCFVARRAVP